MFCGAAIAMSLLLTDPAVAASAAAPAFADGVVPGSVAAEPLFADIVNRADGLHGMVTGWLGGGQPDQADFWTGAEFMALKAQATELAERDMQGHLVLKERNADGDLKCILRGISEDMPKRVDAVAAAPNAGERRVALEELAHLFEDNVQVITSPPAPDNQSGVPTS